MTTLGLLLALAASTINLDVVSVPLSNAVKISLTSGARGELKREGNVTRVKIDIERLAAPASHGPAINTYVVWVASPEGVLENLGELELKGAKGQFTGTTRFSQFALFISAEPHYMVDRPASAVPFRSESIETDFRRKMVPVEVGTYDYSQLKLTPKAVPHTSVAQARTAFQIAQAAGADRLAPAEFRSAQLTMASMEELVNRAASLDILWPTADEAIRLSQRAAVTARAKR
jgi:hypothetical protein